MSSSSSNESEVSDDEQYGGTAFASEPEYTDNEVRQLLHSQHSSQTTESAVTRCDSELSNDVDQLCKCASTWKVLLSVYVVKPMLVF